MRSICLYNATIFTGVIKIKQAALLIKDGKIKNVLLKKRFHKKNFSPDTKFYNLNQKNLSYGFIDTHMHGLEGFGIEDLSEKSILQMSKALVKYGVSCFCPTLYTMQEDRFLKAIKTITRVMGKEEGAKILGLHLEGPFISVHKAGVQPKEYIKKVDIDLMKKYLEAGEGKIINMTVAPELKNMHKMSLFCQNNNILLQAGHSNATYENMIEGMEVGILHSTHFYNAMRSIHHRNPGIAGAILLHKNVSCEIIADGVHVHPSLIKLLAREKPTSKIVLVTDSIKCTCQKGKNLYVNNEEVCIKNDVFIRKKDNVLAGSNLTMNKSIKNMISYGISMSDAICMATRNPSEILNLPDGIGCLLPGNIANLTVFDDDLNIYLTIVDGEIKYNKLDDKLCD